MACVFGQQEGESHVKRERILFVCREEYFKLSSRDGRPESYGTEG